MNINLYGGNTAAPTGAILNINDCKLYIPVVTLSKNDEIGLLTNLKSGFKREIKLNKYRSQMSTEAINNNLNILIDPTFTNVNRLFVLAYQDAADRQSFSTFYLPRVMVKDFNVIIDAEDLDIVMPIYNLLEYSKNYKKTVGSLYNYYRDELSDDGNNNNFLNNNVVDSNTFKYKNKIIGNTYNVDSTIAGAAGARVNNPNYDANRSGKKEVEIAISLKYLGNFWRALNMPLISSEVPLELK